MLPRIPHIDYRVIEKSEQKMNEFKIANVGAAGEGFIGQLCKAAEYGYQGIAYSETVPVVQKDGAVLAIVIPKSTDIITGIRFNFVDAKQIEKCNIIFAGASTASAPFAPGPVYIPLVLMPYTSVLVEIQFDDKLADTGTIPGWVMIIDKVQLANTERTMFTKDYCIYV